MLSNKIKLYFDGSCLGNNNKLIPRKGGFGWQILDEKDEVLKEYSEQLTPSTELTNNIAEWNGLLSALKYLKDSSWDGELEIYGDSQLVINQINGDYKVRNANLLPIFKQCKTILNNFKTWKAIWIDRAKNQNCDNLSRKQ